MTVAIKRSKGDIIWFDAVLQFNRQFSASVSKHPLETGAYVSDHTTTENPILSVSGLVSDVDFNKQRPTLSGSDIEKYDVNQKPFINSQPLPDKIVNIWQGGGKYTQYLPESISQFIEDQPPYVSVSPITRQVNAELVEKYLIEIWRNKEEITLIEFDGNRVSKAHVNCVMTSLTFNETPESGDALWPVMTFEQVSYAISKDTSIPKNVSSAVKNKASGTNGKGNQAVAPAATTDQPQKTDYSKKTSQALKEARTLGVVQ